MFNRSIATAIAVVGMACRYPGANDLKSFWENILARRRQFRTMPDIRFPLADYYDPDPDTPDKTYSNKAALIDGFVFDWAKHRIPKSTVDSTDIAQWLALDVALQSLQDAGLSPETLPKERSGVVLGNTLTGEQSRAQGLRLRWPFVHKVLEAAAKAKGFTATITDELVVTMEEYYKSFFAPITEDTLAGGLSNTIAGRICNYLDIHGGGYTVDGACSSSVLSIATAATSLANHDLDIALAGGVDISLDTFELIGFAKTGALTQTDMTVYDRDADGFLPGEGCGFVVLKRLEDALAQEDKIYALVKGWGISSDGKGGLTAPSAAGQSLALQRAYERAGYSPKEVDFFEGHGTGTAVGDKIELEGIDLALGEEEVSELRPHGITSLKSIIGHTKAASGIGAFIKSVIAVNRRVLPPTAHCFNPNQVFDSSIRTVYPIQRGEIRSPSAQLKAGISGMGFGGINCHVTIESSHELSDNLAPSFDERKLIASHQETELFVISAYTIPELIERTRIVMQKAQGLCEGELVDLAYELSQEFNPDMTVRACVVTGSPDVLFENLLFLEKKLSQSPPTKGKTFISRREDIYIGNDVQQCRVGFLFPGQGSQMLNMGRTLVDRHDWLQQLIGKATAWLQETNNHDISEFIYRPVDKAGGDKQLHNWTELLKQTETAQPAICLTSLLWIQKLARLGIKPEAVGGHSLGELTAFHAAGVFDEESLIKLASIRGRAMAAQGEESGAMASLACSSDIAAEIVNSINGYAIVANINSPEQTVISGEKESVAGAVELAKNQGITTRLLPVSNAFHTKFAQKAAELLRKSAPIPQTIDSLETKIISCMPGKEIHPGLNLHEHFADQVLARVDFISLVRKLEKECDLLVEVGPGMVLTNLTNAIITEKTPVCLPIESKPGLDRNFNAFLGNYSIRGGAIDFDLLYEDRLVRPFVPVSERIFIENPCERPFDVTAESQPIAIESAEPIESTLARAIGVPQKELAAYLAKRGKFLETMIKADMENLPPYQEQPSVEPQSESKRALSEHTISQSLIEIENAENYQPEAVHSVEDLLLESLEKRTGFPRQSLSHDLRLLDDLNLDSIKAADLLAGIAIQLKVAGDFDVSLYANATIDEIINAFRGMVTGNLMGRDHDPVTREVWDIEATLSVVKKIAASLMDRPVETFKAEALIGADLNMDREHLTKMLQHVSKEVNVQLNVDPEPLLGRSVKDLATVVGRIYRNLQDKQIPPQPVEHRPWVREIHARLIEAPFQVHQQARRYEDNWQHACVLLLNSAGNVANVLKNHLLSLGADVTLRELNKDFDPDDVRKGVAYSHLIVTLPQEAQELVVSETQLEAIITRLAAIVSPPHAAAAPRRRTTVAYIQFGGGRFGMSTDEGCFSICCSSALAKSLHLERDDLRVRVLDFDALVSPVTIAEKITAELHTAVDFAAVSYDRSLIRRELKQLLLQPAEYQPRPYNWSEEDVILVTGGAKGITAACAFGLAKETGARMALLGRSPHQDDQLDASISETLKKYEEAGCIAQYFSCDVSNRKVVKDVVQQIRTTMGPITGVIHGAGLNIPRLVSQVSAQEALKEVSPKVLGLINLMEELKDAPPRLFVGLSSIIGVTGMPGNGWYGFSNEALDVLLHRIETDYPETKTLSVAYSIWQEEGMGARLGSISALKEKGVDSIPTEEGVKRFVRLVIKDPGVPQVIIAARLSGLSTFQWKDRIPEPNGRFLEQPLHITPGVESVFQAHLDLETDPYLKDHVFNGSYLFPTVFGLEAMAQAVAHVTGHYDFSRVRIENIQLKRTITVDPDSGADIVIWAELAEQDKPLTLQTVRAGVYKPSVGGNSDFFSATFILGLKEKKIEYEIDLPEKPLDIDPKEDLYNRKILFQGPQFQRIQHIYSLDSSKCIFDSEFHSSDSNNKDSQWLLGDPFFRDSLLHSTQLPVSQHTCLPISIDSIERYSTNKEESDSLKGITFINKRTEEEIHGSVTAEDNNGRLKESINGYVAKIMEFHQDFSSPEELADPGQRDETIIHNEARKRAALVNITIPEISVSFLSGLKQMTKIERHRRELPRLQKTVEQLFLSNGIKKSDIQISWLESGKPVLEGEGSRKYGISLSHDRETVLCIAGEGVQGCDIETITNRPRDKWVALLGKSQTELLDELHDSSDSFDRAGTKIWAAMEVCAKATGSRNANIQIEKQEEDSVLFRVSRSENEDILILTFPILLTLGPERIIAVTVRPLAKKSRNSLPDINLHAEKLNFDLGSYKSAIENGPQGQPVFVFHFPVTFKEASNPSRTLYFSNYFIWLGKLREFMVQPIYDKLVEYFSTGKWGMVTNHAETNIFGEARSGDIIEGRLWLNKISGKEKSTLEFIFEWRKKRTNEDKELIAFSTMSTSWVAIKGHGIVELQPLPGFGLEFVNKLLPRSPLSQSTTIPSNSMPSPDLGDELYREPTAPAKSSVLLAEKVFETCLEDSNLVGNIYFSNYYIWQGRVLDHFMNEIARDYFKTSGKRGELRCVHCEIKHLNEAMPYDRIAIRMYRSAVYGKGVRFDFDYYRLSKDGKRQKLGYGVHEAVWYAPTLNKNVWQPSELPNPIRDALIPKGVRKNRHAIPKRKTKAKNKYDVIVIGSGIGGLTAASLLAKNGADVLVVEQHNKPGGFCTSWERHVKSNNNRTLRYVFDAGVHEIFGLGPQGHVRRLLRELGIEQKMRLLRVDHQYNLSGLQIKVPRSIEEYGDLLGRTFPEERKGITSFFREIQICFSELYSQTSKKQHISQWMGVPFSQMIDTYIRNQNLKKLLTILCNYITDDIPRVMSLTMIPVFGCFIDGGYYPAGGSQVFPDMLAKVIHKHNGDILLNTPVLRIIIERGNAVGIEMRDGNILRAPIIISNADLRRTFLELIGIHHLPTHFSDRIIELRSSNSAFLVTLGVDFIPDIEPVTLLIEGDKSIGIMNPSKIDSSLAPEGHASISLISLISHELAVTWKRGEQDYSMGKKTTGDELIKLAEKVIPGLSNHIVYRQDASPATFARYVWTTDGAIYGTKIDSWKPSVRTPIQGLYLSSASVSARPGVGDAVHAGILASNAIQKEENINSLNNKGEQLTAQHINWA